MGGRGYLSDTSPLETAANLTTHQEKSFTLQINNSQVGSRVCIAWWLPSASCSSRSLPAIEPPVDSPYKRRGESLSVWLRLGGIKGMLLLTIFSICRLDSWSDVVVELVPMNLLLAHITSHHITSHV